MANDIYLKSKTGVKKYPKTYSRNIIDKDTTLQDKLTAGTGIDITNNEISVETSELSYDDLADKPTIPTVDQTYSASSTNAQSGVAVASAVNTKSTVSGTNDGTNWTNITIDGTQMAIPSGGSGGGSTYLHKLYIGTNYRYCYSMLTTTFATTITKSYLESLSKDYKFPICSFLYNAQTSANKYAVVEIDYYYGWIIYYISSISSSGVITISSITPTLVSDTVIEM